MRTARARKTSPKPVQMAVEIGGVRFKNPVLTASGTFAYGLEFSHLMDLDSIGGIVVKGISMKPIDAKSWSCSAHVKKTGMPDGPGRSANVLPPSLEAHAHDMLLVNVGELGSGARASCQFSLCAVA